jgi:hypothetical protein
VLVALSEVPVSSPLQAKRRAAAPSQGESRRFRLPRSHPIMIHSLTTGDLRRLAAPRL